MIVYTGWLAAVVVALAIVVVLIASTGRKRSSGSPASSQSALAESSQKACKEKLTRDFSTHAYVIVARVLSLCPELFSGDSVDVMTSSSSSSSPTSSGGDYDVLKKIMLFCSTHVDSFLDAGKKYYDVKLAEQSAGLGGAASAVLSALATDTEFEIDAALFAAFSDPTLMRRLRVDFDNQKDQTELRVLQYSVPALVKIANQYKFSIEKNNSTNIYEIRWPAEMQSIKNGRGAAFSAIVNEALQANLSELEEFAVNSLFFHKYPHVKDFFNYCGGKPVNWSALQKKITEYDSVMAIVGTAQQAAEFKEAHKQLAEIRAEKQKSAASTAGETTKKTPPAASASVEIKKLLAQYATWNAGLDTDPGALGTDFFARIQVTSQSRLVKDKLEQLATDYANATAAHDLAQKPFLKKLVKYVGEANKQEFETAMDNYLNHHQTSSASSAASFSVQSQQSLKTWVSKQAIALENNTFTANPINESLSNILPRLQTSIESVAASVDSLLGAKDFEHLSFRPTSVNILNQMKKLLQKQREDSSKQLSEAEEKNNALEKKLKEATDRLTALAGSLQLSWLLGELSKRKFSQNARVADFCAEFVGATQTVVSSLDGKEKRSSILRKLCALTTDHLGDDVAQAFAVNFSNEPVLLELPSAQFLLFVFSKWQEYQTRFLVGAVDVAPNGGQSITD
jgi:hypothetical protein